MKPYPKYKPSGIEMLGDVPEHWEVKRLKYVIDISNGDGVNLDELDDKGDIPIYGGNGIMGYYSKSNSNSQEIIIGRVGAKCGNVHLVDGKKWISDNALRASTNQNYNYLALLLTSLDLNRLANQSAQPLITSTQIANLAVAIPPIKEQVLINETIGDKTKKIDLLIKQKGRLIELLKEERQAVINHAVKKGLDTTVKMKPSGTEWLGDVPEHWEVKPLKYVCDLFNYIRIPLSSEERGEMAFRVYDYYGASGIIDKVESYLFDGRYILVGEDGANLLTRNTPLAFLAEGKFWVNNHAHILKSKVGSDDYLVNLLESYDFAPLISGSAQPKLTVDNLKGILIPVPSPKEQYKISEFIQRQNEYYTNLVQKQESMIALLQEYRTALITEIVTGKRMVGQPNT